MYQEMIVDMEEWSCLRKLMPGFWFTCDKCGTAVRVPGKAFDIFGGTVSILTPIVPPGCGRCRDWWDVRLINSTVDPYDATVIYATRLRGF